MTYRSFLSYLSKVIALAFVIACACWAMMGPFVALINAASTFAVFGAIITAILAVFGGGFLVWKIIAAIINQAHKEMI